ncbi:MAG: PHP domain-containing protein [Clostridiales bacterium]|nr:PHP domain-containing protein [Candidatus Apopatousia equi]
MKTDLHIHTKYSDGEFDEFEIIERVHESGVQEFCICDHDTIKGSEKVFNLLKKENKYNLIFHSGVELSCRINDFHGGINLHILYRDFDYNNPKLQFFLDEINEKRMQKIDVMIEHIYKNFGVKIEKQKVLELFENTCVVGKPHMYKLLCEYGDFDREEYYSVMNSMKTQSLKLNLYEVLDSLKDEQGYFTLAHPIEIMEEYNLSYDDIDDLAKLLKFHGLKAMETKHSKISKEQYEKFHEIAVKYDLIETCGSDYHGPSVKPDVMLGKCEKV